MFDGIHRRRAFPPQTEPMPHRTPADAHHRGHDGGDGGAGCKGFVDEWYNPGYTRAMKTAISIPNELFESAEGFARRLGMTRSELYAKALRDYLREHEGEGITERLDEVYGAEERGSLDPVVARLQGQSLPEDGW